MTTRETTRDRLLVVSAADDAYALPLAVTIRSLLDRLAADRALTLFVLDGGISASHRERLLDSWADPRLTVEWVACPPALVHGLTVSGHVSPTAYARLLMHRLLPPGIGKILYIDADILFRRDVGLLWDEPLDDNVMLAVTDAGAPVLDAAVALPHFDRCGRWLVTPRPIPNYEACGLSPHARYFNSGVMLIDLVRWRERGIGDRALEVLHEHERHVLWWDQYALNIVLAGQWGELDGRWNQVAAIFRYPNWRSSPLDRRVFKAIRHDPWVVHFCSADKPWRRESRHPWTGRYRAMIRRTAWRRPHADDARSHRRRLLHSARWWLAARLDALLSAGLQRSGPRGP